MRVLRAPTVVPGDRVTARWANAVADAVNEGLQAPKDLGAGTRNGVEVPTIPIPEIQRTSEDVRVENPLDSEQYVIEARATESILYNETTQEKWRITWLNEE